MKMFIDYGGKSYNVMFNGEIIKDRNDFLNWLACNLQGKYSFIELVDGSYCVFSEDCLKNSVFRAEP